LKQQIVRLSLHQNAKVMAILMAVNSLIFFVPLVLIATLSGAPQAQQGLFLLLVMPIAYLVIGYILCIIGCAVYNFLVRYIGGFEFESNGDSV
jgi:hypothetical protein